MEGEREFSVDFTPDGILKLQERMKEKIRDLRGEFTDDDQTLLDYIIVLLQNGRSKADTIKGLDFFLQSHSAPFVSWLWDHLYSNQPINSTDKDGLKSPSTNRDKRDFQKESDRKEIFPLSNLVTHILHGEDNKNNNGIKKDPPKSPNDIKKRIRADEPQPRKRDPSPNMSRRLLQFAVRDAVKPTDKTNSIKTEYSSRKTEYSSQETEYSSQKTEYSSKRLRSTVCTSPITESALNEYTSPTRRSYRISVFDRLTTVTSPLTSPVTSLNVAEKEVMDFDNHNDESNYKESKYEESKCEDSKCEGSKYEGSKCEYFVDKKIEENDEMYESETESEDDFQIIMPDSSNSDDFYNRVLNTKMAQNEELNKVESASINGDVSNKEASLSTGSEASVIGGETECQISVSMVKRPKFEGPQKNSLSQESSSYTNSSRLDDVDSRSIFISNVNFGATKDALAHHFNQFGAVLDAALLCDPDTGQPTGSACVEFLQKGSAETALSLSGTYFMSRIIKVVKRNSPEATQYLGWHSTTTTTKRGALFSYGSRPRGRAPFRDRPPIRAGPRSLQWKRDTSASAVQPGACTNCDATM